MLQEEFADDPLQLNTAVIRFSKLLDKLGLLTFEEFARGRESLVKAQQESILELSSPIVTVWDGILAVPIIGILDSNRTQQLMEDLLTAIVDSGSRVAIIDITGVAVVDTLVATHLTKTVDAIRLMGATTARSWSRASVPRHRIWSSRT